MKDPHDLAAGGHVPIDVDPFLPTGICAVCIDVPHETEAPEDRTPV